MPAPPLPPMRPGRGTPRRWFDAVADWAHAALGLSVSPPLELITLPGQRKLIRLAQHLPVFVRVSGKQLDPSVSQSGSGSYGGSTVRTPRDDDYSAVEQITGLDSDIADYGQGLHFWADTLPLREVSGDGDVPAGTYAYAIPAPQGDHWLFSAAAALMCPDPCDQSGSGSGCCVESGDGTTAVTTAREVEFRSMELCDDGTCCEVVTKIRFPCPVRVCVTQCCGSGSGGVSGVGGG